MIDYYYYDLLSSVAEVHVMDPIYFGSISFILHFKFSSLMCCYLDRHCEPHTLCLTCGILSLVSIIIKAKPIHKPTLGLLIQDFIGCCRMINQTSSYDMRTTSGYDPEQVKYLQDCECRAILKSLIQQISHQ